MKTRQLTAILLSVALLMFVCPALASDAETTNYNVREAELIVDIPSNYFVIQPDFFEDEAMMKIMGITTEDRPTILPDDCYLCALEPEKPGTEIRIYAFDMPVGDFSEMSQEERDAFGQIMLDSLVSGGFEQASYEIWKSERADYLRTTCFNATDNCWVFSYMNIVNGRAITITTKAFNLDDREAAELTSDNVVASIRYSNYLTISEERAKELAALFAVDEEPAWRNEDFAISIPIPTGWTETTSDMERSMNHFSMTKEDGSCQVIYACGDLWNEFPEADRIALGSRQNVTNDLFTNEMVLNILRASNLLSPTSGTVTKTRYGGEEYFRVRSDLTVSINDVSESTLIDGLVRVYDGRMHMFIFYGDVTSEITKGHREIMPGVRFD